MQEVKDSKWYAVRVYTEMEDKVLERLELSLSRSPEMQTLISRVLVPKEKVSEVKSGKKRVIEKKIYPGYVLVEMKITDASWLFVNDINGITGFVGNSSTEPVPLSDNEIARIITELEYRQETTRPKLKVKVGESVRIKEGSFENYEGVVENIDNDKGLLKVMVPIFGRSTPVELEFWQIEAL